MDFIKGLVLYFMKNHKCGGFPERTPFSHSAQLKKLGLKFFLEILLQPLPQDDVMSLRGNHFKNFRIASISLLEMASDS